MIIRNGSCAFPGEDRLLRRDLRISDGRIVAIAESLGGQPGEDEFDATGLEIFPGAIDPHVHFDEPGFTHREDFRHGSMAAARGGVTAVIDMPCTSLPPVVNAEGFREKLEAIGETAVVDFALFGGVSGHRVEQALAGDMAELAPDVVGFKCYFVSGMDTFTAVDHYSFGKIARAAHALGRPLLLHAEDPSVVLPATRFMHELAQREDREPTWDDYVDSRPESAELAAVAAARALARGIEPTLHVVHVGCAEAALEAVNGGDQQAQRRLRENLRGYAALLTAHIAKENNVLFPLAERTFSDTDRRQLIAGFERIEEERVGEGEHERLRGIAEELSSA